MKNKILAIGICALMLLVVFSSGCIDFGHKTYKANGFYAMAMTPWVNVTGGASATVLSITPSNIKWADITWQLYNYSADVLKTGAVFTHYLDGDGDGCLDTGDEVMVTIEKTGTFKVRAILGGDIGMIYESAAFII